MDAPKVIFRKKMGGYNKEDVNKYITSENQRFMRAKSDYQKSLADRDREIERITDELNTLRDVNTSATSTLSEQNHLIESYKDTIVELETRIKEMEETIAHLEEVKDDPIYQKNEVVIDESVFDKAKSYDSLCAQVDEILAYAKSEADRIINAAVESAKKIERTKNGDISKIKSDISSKSSSIIDELRRAIKDKTR